MTESIVSIFVVLFDCGRNEDHRTLLVRAFSDKETADRFTSRKNSEIDEMRGMCRAADTLLQVWSEANPLPDCNDADKGTYYAWTELRFNEANRIDSLLGIEAAFAAIGLSRYDGEDAHYMVSETKLGSLAWD